MTLCRLVMSNDGTRSYPEVQESNQLRCMILLRDNAALHNASRTQSVNTVVVLGSRMGCSSTVATGYLKLRSVWVKSTNLLFDCVEEKYFRGTNELHLTV